MNNNRDVNMDELIKEINALANKKDSRGGYLTQDLQGSRIRIALRITATAERILSELPAGAFHNAHFGTHAFHARPWSLYRAVLFVQCASITPLWDNLF